MAGSYGHVVADNGKLLRAEDFAQMVENLGDAFETVEQMYGAIWWLGAELAAVRQESPGNLVDAAVRNHRQCLEASPGTGGELSGEDE